MKICTDGVRAKFGVGTVKSPARTLAPRPALLHWVSAHELEGLRESMARGGLPLDLQGKLESMTGGNLSHRFIGQNCRLFAALLLAAGESSFRDVSAAERERLLRVLAYVRKDDDAIFPDSVPRAASAWQNPRASLQNLQRCRLPPVDEGVKSPPVNTARNQFASNSPLNRKASISKFLSVTAASWGGDDRQESTRVNNIKNRPFLCGCGAGESHRTDARRETTEEEARCVLREELAALSAALARPFKGVARKVRIARRVRAETSVTLKWIAEHLHMGTWTHVAKGFSQHPAQSDYQPDLNLCQK